MMQEEYKNYKVDLCKTISIYMKWVDIKIHFMETKSPLEFCVSGFLFQFYQLFIFWDMGVINCHMKSLQSWTIPK